jgi:branched-chain amino acid transport system ATP-binding protein
MISVLKIKQISSGYGESQIIFDINMQIDQGTIVSLVGSNAAGKTTLINTISGLIKAWSGKVEFLGEDITALSPAARVDRGLIQTPEGRRLFPDLTIRENLLMGSYSKVVRAKRQENLDYVYYLFPKLLERTNQLAGSLSGGEQQMCAVARSLMACPKLLILDEPSLGLAPILIVKVFEIIEDIKKKGVTILLVEQNVQKALCLADKAYVLESGRITLEGTGQALLKNDQLQKAYLGI